MQERVYNFSAGPAVLPVPVLKKAQEELLALPGVGSSVMEISHRSKTFVEIIETAEANLRDLMSIPDNYSVLFLQGGAQLQFAMAPMNLLAGTDQVADYILTGSWGKKAIGEAKTQCKTHVAWDGAEEKYTRNPLNKEIELDANAGYVHFTSNETIQGIQWQQEPEVGDLPLLCDASSDILCRPVDISKYGMLYACAQKNVGPAGVTLVVMRDDLIERCPDDLPNMLSYKNLDKAKSLLNTPPCFAIYMVKLVTEWLRDDIGGLEKMYQINREKAKMLYDVIDDTDGFYDCPAHPQDRSIMNVVFRLPNETLENEFLAESAQNGLTTLKGHRSVGGFRASIYNAMPVEGVEALRDFMVDFAKKNG
jgi:phosphoserine aminotransferase